MWHGVIHPQPQLRYTDEYFYEKQEPFYRREILDTIRRQSIENVTSYLMAHSSQHQRLQKSPHLMHNIRHLHAYY